MCSKNKLKKMTRISNSLILLFFTSILFFSCKPNHSQIEEKQKFVISDSLLKTLQIDSITMCPLINTITLTGKVSFNEDKIVRIFPMVSGNITNVNVQLGDQVHRGQTLGIIRSSEMAGYSNDLITSKTNLLIAKKNLDASEDMYKSGLLSQKDFMTAQELYKQSESQLKRSNEVLQINGGNTQGQFLVKAPISGFVVEKFINNNMTIRPDNANSLFTISDLSNVWILANVYESNINQVHLGDSVQITSLSYPGRIFRGKVDKILNVLDPTNKVMKIRVELPNPDYALKPEMFASVTVVNKTNKESLCVPSQSLIFDHSQYYILVYNSPSDVKIIPVQVINTNAGRSYITGALKVGDKIISSNVVLIYGSLNS